MNNLLKLILHSFIFFFGILSNVPNKTLMADDEWENPACDSQFRMLYIINDNWMTQFGILGLSNAGAFGWNMKWGKTYLYTTETFDTGVYLAAAHLSFPFSVFITPFMDLNIFNECHTIPFAKQHFSVADTSAFTKNFC